MKPVNSLKSILYFLIVVVFFAASCDVIFNVELFSFNFRLCQLAMLGVVLLALLKNLQCSVTILPLGFAYLISWAVLIACFVPNTDLLLRNITYLIWLFYSIAFIYALVQFSASWEFVQKVVRCYIYSFGFVALFGVVQFVAGLAGIDLLVSQWWFAHLPRINGFSYEPSFFSTYILTGFIFVGYLRSVKSTLMGSVILSIIYWICLCAMILSTSRMGWLMCAIWLFRDLLLLPLQLKKYIRFAYIKRLFTTLAIACTCIVVIGSFIEWNKLEFLVGGLGINGGASHSSETRWNEFFETLIVFRNSPFVGVGLGGVPSARAVLNNTTVNDNLDAKLLEGANVFAEVLAASGIIGFLIFITYMYILIIHPYRFANTTCSQVRHILKGLVISFVFLLAILQFNQNILRSYVWIHIALLSMVYASAKMNNIKFTTQVRETR